MAAGRRLTADSLGDLLEADPAKQRSFFAQSIQ